MAQQCQGRCGEVQAIATAATGLACFIFRFLRRPLPDHKGMMIFGDDYVTPAGWKGNIVLHQERMDECKKDKIITIEAWDLS
ncbi:MAG: hypothetical protein KGM99_12825 [Burkholderiales bacterium]|nr:hypothetical protein [Burkholderiales bacterium]